jgi:hypothetical protein
MKEVPEKEDLLMRWRIGWLAILPFQNRLAVTVHMQ